MAWAGHFQARPSGAQGRPARNGVQGRMGGAWLLDRGTVRSVGPVRAAEPGRRLATLHPWERLPRHPPAPMAPHPRSPLCRPQKARVSGQALVQTLRQLPPGWRAADASGGPARRPPRSPCTAQGPAQPGQTPEPGPALPWRASALAAALGPGLLGGRGHTATMPQGEGAPGSETPPGTSDQL